MIIKFAKPEVNLRVIYDIIKILKNGIFVHGERTKTFENNLAKFFKTTKLISTSSCTASMHLFYLSIGLKKNDEVIVSAQTHVATAHAVEICGAKPIFVDCELNTGNIKIDEIEKKITNKTKCISITHFLGKPVDMYKILKISKKYNLKVLEDTALSIGSSINNKLSGTFGDAGAFSFHPVKIITTGEGGALILNSKKLYEYCKSIRSFGYDIFDPSKRKIPGNYNVNNLGLNYRLSEIEASIGIHELKEINKKIKIRSKNFNMLYEGLRKIKNIKLLNTQSEGNLKSSYYAITVILDSKNRVERNNIILRLQKLGIQTSIYYPHPVPLLKYYKTKYKFTKDEFPNARRIAYNSFSITVAPHIGNKQIEYIIRSLRKVLGKNES